MYTGTPHFPSQSVNAVLQEIATVVGGVNGIDMVYPYRAMRTEHATAVAVTSIRVGLGNSSAGVRMAYDYIVDLLVRIDDDPAAAEYTLNELDEAIWKSLWGPRLPTWQDCYPYNPTDKPSSPNAMTGWRRAILYVRVIPN